MGFFDDVKNFLGDVTGQTQSNKGYKMADTGAENEAQAAALANQLGNKSATQFAGEAGAAGEQLGARMGQQAAQLGTQQAMQAARTAGLNKGQAALEGGQQAGRLFTQGQMQGQGLGMSVYGQGAGQQLGAAGLQGNIGANQYEQGLAMKGLGRQAGQDVMSGIAKLAGGMGGGGATAAKGGIINKPTIAGEAGPEAVLPLSDKERTAQILEKLGFKKGAAEARSMKCPTCGGEMKGKANANERKA